MKNFPISNVMVTKQSEGSEEVLTGVSWPQRADFDKDRMLQTGTARKTGYVMSEKLGYKTGYVISKK